MLNNEQLPIPGVPFPNYHSQQYVSYGIIDGTNIGYIYLYREVEGTSDQQFYEAVTALHETDALIIDMRLNFGGWAFFNSSLNLLFNQSHLTIEDAYRCNSSNFTLCPFGNSPVFSVPGNPPALYDRPIAIFLGPTCVSMGDITAQRFRYHPTVRFFGKPSAASLGDNIFVANYPDWNLRHSISDMFHVSEPAAYLNRTEFPLDYSIWFDPTDVANGYDTVVEEALEWINNLVYGHNVTTNMNYLVPGIDSVLVSATIENPNSHPVNSKIYVRDLENTLIDSLELIETEIGDIWQGSWPGINYEDIFKFDIKSTDQTTGDSFTIDNVARITTAGPIVLVDTFTVTYNSTFKFYQIKPYIKNEGQTFTVENLSINIFVEDSSVTIVTGTLNIASVAPGETVSPTGAFTIKVDSNFIGNFNCDFEIKNDGWTYWYDSKSIVLTNVKEEEILLISYRLYQNFPNPCNPSTKIKYSIPQSSNVVIKVFDILGNEIETLVNDEKQTGTYKITWYAENLPSGIYFYRLQAGDFVETKKMVLMK
jgi:hypothetical protein